MTASILPREGLDRCPCGSKYWTRSGHCDSCGERADSVDLIGQAVIDLVEPQALASTTALRETIAARANSSLLTFGIDFDLAIDRLLAQGTFVRRGRFLLRP